MSSEESSVYSFSPIIAELPVDSPVPDFTLSDLSEYPEFPLIPSAYYYYFSWKGHPVPLLNQGTPIQQEESLRIWIALKQNFVFPLKISYAQAREDQVNILPSLKLPDSEISSSMSSAKRQYPDSNSHFFNDRFQLIVSQVPDFTIDDFLSDFYRYPLNPSANAFEAARLLELYISTDSDNKEREKELRKYLADRDIISLKDHSFDYYPIYELFFLLTRFYSPPLTYDQIQLAQRRNLTQFNSSERQFIDSIFHLYIYDLDKTLEVIDLIQNNPERAMEMFNTPFSDWVQWANEYLNLMDTPAQDIDYIGETTIVTGEKYYTWTDLQLVEWLTQLELNIPYRSEFFNRKSWVNHIAGMIQKYRTSESS